MKISVDKLLKSIEKKEKAIRKGIDNLKPSDLTKSEKEELVDEVENMIEKMENLKTEIQRTVIKKAS